MKKLLILACMLWSAVASAQFTPGQLLTAAELNSQFALYSQLSGAIFTGPVTIPALTVTTPNPSIQYLGSSTGSVSRTQSGKLGDTLSLLDFGADPTDTVSSSTAFSNWFSAVLLTGKAGYIPAGKYKLTSQVILNLASVQNAGVRIYGDGPSSILDLTSLSSGPALLIENTNNTGAFYSSFVNFAVQTNVNGVGVQVGQESFADAMNSFQFNLIVNNNSTGSSACAVELNYVLDSAIYLVTNVKGSSAGDSLRLRQAQFNTIGGSFSNALNGLHLTSGFNFGNLFQAPDIEVVGTNVVIDNAQSTSNTTVGGQFVWVTSSINATAGAFNRFIGTNFGSTPVIASGTGIYIDNTGYGALPIGATNPSTGNFTGVSTASLTVTGAIAQNSSGPSFTMNDTSGANATTIFFQSNGTNAWEIFKSSSGNFAIGRYVGGVFTDDPISIAASTGIVNIPDGATVGGTLGAAAITASSTITPSQTNGIVGTTTNNNANAGSVGEYISNSTAGTSLTAGTTANCTSASLTAGDWDVTAVVRFNPAGTTTINFEYAGINTTSATLGALGTFVLNTNTFTTGSGSYTQAPIVRVSLASTTTVFAVAQASFAASTMTCDGFIRARRVR